KRPYGLDIGSSHPYDLIAWQRPTLAERKSATIGAKELPLLRDKRSHLSSLSSFACSFSSTKLAALFPQFISFNRFLFVKLNIRKHVL
ncbi:hypothetical protein, partial [Staphylococcus petrasii]|uniref:hypothetical protein n=1 Tax=Staphylococcus petrasii TaxID=1276936 RepID=UPI00197DDC0E